MDTFPQKINSESFSLNKKDSSIGHIFEGFKIEEKYYNALYMSLNSLPYFSSLSYEEYRLADYKIINNSNSCSSNIFNFSSDNKLFKYNDNIKLPLFGNINDNQEAEVQDNNNIYYIYELPSNQDKSLDNNSQGTSLFGNLNKNGNSLFGAQSTIFGGNNKLFNFGNINKGEDIKQFNLFEGNNKGSLFGNINNQDNSIFRKINTESNILFGNNNFRSNKDIYGNPMNQNFTQINNKNIINNEIKNITQIQRNTRNNINPNKEIIKCKHDNDYISYCIKDSNNEGGLLCYKCLYEYHKDHISQCIPIKNNNFESYKNFYKEYMNKYKTFLKDKFDEIISLLEKYENEEINNISDLLEQKLDLNYDLPIEIPFIERIEFSINKKISSLLNDKLLNNELIFNCLNLFKNNLNELKFSQNNPNNNEEIKIKSSINFNLLGIGIPKILNYEDRFIEVNIYKEGTLLETIKDFENKDNLSLGIIKNEPIEIENNKEYTIELKGIDNLEYISNEEEFNDNSKIIINSNNPETILACLIIE